MIIPTDMLEEAPISNYNLVLVTLAAANLLKKASRWTTMAELLEDQLLLKMAQSTPDNGSMASETALAPKCGQTVPSTKANGRTTKPTVKAN
jgi:hypothetical protein